MRAALLAPLLISTLGAAASSFTPRGFDFAGPSNRVVTPNGDGFNDTVVFRFTNTRDSAGTIKIFDLRGRELRSISFGVGDTTASWDGRASGTTVSAGVYIYVIQAEGKAKAGTLLVVR